jgi:hypothetical protein
MPERRLAAGKNTATQTPFLGASVRADFFESQHTGHDLIRTPLGAPFDEMLIRMPRAHHADSPLVYTENLIRVDDVMESPNLTE